MLQVWGCAAYRGGQRSSCASGLAWEGRPPRCAGRERQNWGVHIRAGRLLACTGTQPAIASLQHSAVAFCICSCRPFLSAGDATCWCLCTYKLGFRLFALNVLVWARSLARFRQTVRSWPTALRRATRTKPTGPSAVMPRIRCPQCWGDGKSCWVAANKVNRFCTDCNTWAVCNRNTSQCEACFEAGATPATHCPCTFVPAAAAGAAPALTGLTRDDDVLTEVQALRQEVAALAVQVAEILQNVRGASASWSSTTW